MALFLSLILSFFVCCEAKGCGILGTKQQCSYHGQCRTSSGCLRREECFHDFDKDPFFDKCVCDAGYWNSDCSWKRNSRTRDSGTSNGNPFMLAPVILGIGFIVCLCCCVAFFAGGCALLTGGNRAGTPNFQMSGSTRTTTPPYAQHFLGTQSGAQAYATATAIPSAQSPFIQTNQAFATAVPVQSPIVQPNVSQAFAVAPPSAPIATAVPVMEMSQVMPMWNPNAMCDGSTAQERVNWLQQNQGMTLMAAQQRVMAEYPSMFSGAGGFSTLPRWNPNAMCDCVRAEDRAIWLRDNKGMNMEMARQEVMSEFPGQF